MKNAKKIILATVAFVAIAAHAADGPVYEYEIRSPGYESPVRILARVGEIQTVTVRGREIEFTNEETTVPAKLWKSMEAAGTSPAHDFVKCGGKTCTFGTKTRLNSSVQVSIRPTTLNGVVMTSFRYANTDYKLAGKIGGVAMPQFESREITDSVPLAAEGRFSITDGSDVIAVLSLVSIKD